MVTIPWSTIGLVVLFIIVSGMFSATEFALISLRDSQLDKMAEGSARGRRVARVARDPNRFLAALQIGATVAGLLSAAFGASAIAPAFTPLLRDLGLSETAAANVALIGLTLVIAYFQLVVGELAPKRLALQRADTLAMGVGPTVDRFASFMRPLIWLLSISTDLVVRLVGGDPKARASALDEAELRLLIAGQGTLDDDERRILTDVLEAGDRTIVESMTPRGEVEFLPAALTLTEAAERVRAMPYSRYPVTGRGFDDVLGFVHVRDVLQPPPSADPDRMRVHAVMRPILALPGTNRAIESMSQMRKVGAQIAVVLDEYGGTDGIVALEDLVEELVGDIRDEYDRPAIVHAPGTYDAGMTIEEFARHSGLELADGPYETVAGYVVARLGRLATVGDAVEIEHEAAGQPGNGDRSQPSGPVVLNDLAESKVSPSTLTVTEVEGRRIRAVSVA